MDIPFSRVFAEGGARLTQNGNVLRCEERKFPYASAAVTLHDLFPDATGYFSSVRVRSLGKPVSLRLFHKLFYTVDNREFIGYVPGDAVTVGSEWVTVSARSVRSDRMTINKLISYCYSAANDLDSLEFSDFTAEPVGEKLVVGEYIQKPRPGKTLVGAIRWDAYFSTKEEYNVSRQVARSLSPEKYHYRTPYFARVTQDGGVDFAEPTQEQFDEEAKLAIDAGIGYFAYCWYDTAMDYARRQHLVSRFRDQIKMCAIIHVGGFSWDGLAESMRSDAYLTYLGYPVVFVFNGGGVTREYLEKTHEAARKAGFERAYLVGMGGTDPLAFMQLQKLGYDAVSAYSFGPNGKGEPYASLASRCEQMNEARYEFAAPMDVIPQIAYGFDFRPRIDHPVSWMGGQLYSLPGTEQEHYEHAAHVLESLRAHPEATSPNMVIAYAWNEHDEGGWICPCLPSDPAQKWDDTHLRAFRRAVMEHREKE